MLQLLDDQAAYAQKYELYYNGDQQLPVDLTTSRYREQFTAMIRAISDNWLPIIVDATAERCNVEGFRFGDDVGGDTEAADIWQRNNLDADSTLAMTTALKCGRAFTMVWADEERHAEITIEDPREVAVAYVAGNRRRRKAAVKRWYEGTDEYANLYLPDQVVKFVRKDKDKEWTTRETLTNPLGRVPVVEIPNRPALRGKYLCKSELHEFTSTQDQITKIVIDMLVASEFAAFPQRWATGIEMPVDEDGKLMEEFKAAIDRMWTSANEGTKFGEFREADLKNYVTAYENRIQSLASRSRTPAHYMLGASGSFPSGESLKATETGLVAKVRERQRFFGEAWEETMRLAFAAEGNEAKSKEWKAETIWRDPESRTESEHIDATMKKKAIGVPDQQLFEDMGYTPQQIARFRTMLLEQAITQRMAQPAQTISQPTVPDSSFATADASA